MNSKRNLLNVCACKYEYEHCIPYRSIWRHAHPMSNIPLSFWVFRCHLNKEKGVSQSTKLSVKIFETDGLKCLIYLVVCDSFDWPCYDVVQAKICVYHKETATLATNHTEISTR